MRFSESSSARVEPSVDPTGPVAEPFLTFSDLTPPSTGEGPALRQESGPAPPASSKPLRAIALT